MSSTVKNKIGQVLADIAALAKSLGAVHEDCDAVEHVHKVLSARRDELSELEGRLERANQDFTKADAEHSHWQKVSAAARAQTNADVDRLQSRLQALEQGVAERQKESDNILDGIKALGRRLKV